MNEEKIQGTRVGTGEETRQESGEKPWQAPAGPSIVAVIPARWGSSRLPGKPLEDLGGKSVIQRVVEQTRLVIPDVIVATDDQRIVDAVEKFGGKAVLTVKPYHSGSDRVADVVRDMDVDIVVNVQGDEPFLDPEWIREALAPILEDPGVVASTVMIPIDDDDDLDNIGVVKVVTDMNGDALYFSRSLIPYPRNQGHVDGWYEHPGIYVFRKGFLMEFASWQPSPLEQTESLEQLRILEHGYKLRVVKSSHGRVAPCIDTPEDLERCRRYLASLS